MGIYAIKAGIGGGFNSYEFEVIEGTMREAEILAEEIATQVYESYEGCHGIRGYSEIEEEVCAAIEEEGEKLSDEEVNNQVEYEYQEEKNRWIDYEVKEIHAHEVRDILKAYFENEGVLI